MEKKLVLLVVLAIIIPFTIASSIPQFLIFQGNVKIDGRIALEGSVIFSIEGTEIANTNISDGNYGPIFIQGFEELYGKPINITIVNGTKKYEAEQKINYIYPQHIFLNLSVFTEKALKISSSYPIGNEIKIQKTGIYVFNISTKTDHADIVNHSWYLDGKSILNVTNTNESSFSYEVNNNDTGEHNISVIVSDGFLTRNKEWTLIIARPETSSFGGSTTDFDSLGLDELESVPNLVLEKVGKGKIEFLEDLNLSGIIDLDNNIKIEGGIVAVNTQGIPKLNQPARITLTGLSYNTIPKIFYSDGFTTNPLLINQECDFCNIINYTPHPTTNGTVVFEVEHFSSFRVGGSGEIYDLDLFDNLDKCENGTQGNLTINVKEPDKGDEFKQGEKMEIKVEVENNADEDKDIIVEAILFDTDKDKEEEDARSGDKNIDEGEEEIFELELEIPDDLDDKDYILFVKAYEEDEEDNQCNYEIIDFELVREEHDVVIKEMSIEPESVYNGDWIRVSIEVENVGTSSEDVYVILSNELLGISERSESFELEDFEGDNEGVVDFIIKIPLNASGGDYTFKAEAVFDGEEDSRESSFIIKEKEIVPLWVEEEISIKPISEEFKTGMTSESKILVFDFFLIIGIILIAALIIIYKKRVS